MTQGNRRSERKGRENGGRRRLSKKERKKRRDGVGIKGTEGSTGEKRGSCTARHERTRERERETETERWKTEEKGRAEREQSWWGR